MHFAHRRLSIIDLRHGQQPLVKRPFVALLQRRAVQLPGDQSRTGRRGAQFHDHVRHRGRPRGMAALGTRVLATVSRHVRLRHARSSDRLSLPRSRPVRDQAPALHPPEGRRRVRLRAQGPGERVRLRACTCIPQALVASMLYYWVPDQMCSVRGVEKLQPGSWAEFRPDGTHRVERYWDVVEEAAAAQETDYDLREVIEDSVNGAPRRRRSGVELPLRWPRLEHRDRAGEAGQSPDRRVHHHVPSRGPSA